MSGQWPACQAQGFGRHDVIQATQQDETNGAHQIAAPELVATPVPLHQHPVHGARNDGNQFVETKVGTETPLHPAEFDDALETAFEVLTDVFDLLPQGMVRLMELLSYDD